MGVVRRLVHVLPQHIARQPAQQVGTCTVDKVAAAQHVDAKNAFAGRLEQLRQLVAPNASPGARQACYQRLHCRLQGALCAHVSGSDGHASQLASTMLTLVQISSPKTGCVAASDRIWCMGRFARVALTAVSTRRGA